MLSLPIAFTSVIGVFAQTFAASCNILVLDNGAFHTAKPGGGYPPWPRCLSRPIVPNSTPWNACGAI
jgi:hypothetical protein